MPKFNYQRRVPFPAGPVFDIVADVERYPLFLPGWRRARILERHDNVFTVEQTLGGLGFSWEFRTRAVFDRPDLIRIESGEHPFRHLSQVWRFKPVDEHHTLVSLEADFALADLALRGLLTTVFERGIGQTLDAFEKRAHELLD